MASLRLNQCKPYGLVQYLLLAGLFIQGNECMAEYRTPGVYIDEIPTAVRPITGVATATAAFVGEVQTGDAGGARLINSYADFERLYGQPLENRHLARSVRLFFTNGGSRLYIAPVPAQDSTELNERAYRDAFGLLDTIGEISLLAVPGVGNPGMVEMGAEYCRKRGDCFFIADLSATVDSVSEAQQTLTSTRHGSSYAARYFPWLQVKDWNTGAVVSVPPSGAVAGIYARIDASRGVWKAPAGREASVAGVTGQTLSVSSREQGRLNPLGLNVIRDNVGPDILLWGARTFATSDPEFRYVAVRRMAIYLEDSISQGTQWAVFESNEPALWSKLERSVSNFLYNLFRQGAFAGTTPDEAYFVKCDYETMTQTDIDQGIVNIQIGFAPLRPAEFVVLRIRQKVARAQ